MPIHNEEIISDIEYCIRRFGGGFGEWCVGAAKDARGPFFRHHQQTNVGDGLAYREAYTTTAAQAVVAHFVNDRGLEPVPEGEPESALQAAVSEAGRLVFVYRKNPPATAAPRSGQPTGRTVDVQKAFTRAQSLHSP